MESEGLSPSWQAPTTDSYPETTEHSPQIFAVFFRTHIQTIIELHKMRDARIPDF
jgi:hypothetical protein